MADEPITLTDDAQEGPDGRITISRAAFDNMRAAADRRTPKEPEVDNSALQRENAFLRAGVDLDNPKAKFLVNGWGDDPLDPEAIRTAAEDLGVLRGVQTIAEPPPEPPADPRETAVRQGLQSSSVAVGQEPEEPANLVALKQGRDVIARGGNFEDAIAALSASVRAGAVAGDRSVLLTGGEAGEPVQDIESRKGYLNARDLFR